MSGIDSNTTLMCHFDGTNGSTSTVDSSSNAFAVSGGASSIILSNSQFEFPPTSASFPNAAAAWSVNDVATSSGTVFVPIGDFTIDFWFWVPDNVTEKIPIIKRSSNNISPYAIDLFSDTAIQLYMSSDGTSFNVASGFDTGLRYSPNVMTHFALVRSGSTFTPFQNGIGGNTVNFVGNLIAVASAPFTCGDPRASAGPASGFVDELRFSNSARWLTNFTPSSAPYSSTAVAVTIFYPSITYPNFRRSFRVMG